MIDYRQSGVDIDAGNETVRRIKSLARSTFTSGVLSDIGSFGGLFRLDRDRYRERDHDRLRLGDRDRDRGCRTVTVQERGETRTTRRCD